MPNAATTDADLRVPWLDGMRGVAILLVMVVHFTAVTMGPSPSRFDYAIRKVGSSGWAGVDLFFVLSGMLITGILLDTKGSAGYWRRFYIRRALRIFPLYYVFLGAMLLSVPLLFPASHEELAQFRHATPWFSLYLTDAWVALRHGVAINLFGTGVVWSLAVEEQFYLVWPFVVLLFHRRQLMMFCVALIVVAPLLRAVLLTAGAPQVVTYEAMPTRCDALAAGALLAIALRDRALLRVTLRASVLGASAALAAILTLGVWRGAFDWHDSTIQIFGFTPLLMLMSAFVAQGFQDGGVARAMSAPALRWLGKYSYAIYLFHFPIATWLAVQLRLPERLTGIGIPEPVADPLFWLIASAISLAAAWISWHTLEKHFLKLKRYVRYDREARVTPGVESAAARPTSLREAA